MKAHSAVGKKPYQYKYLTAISMLYMTVKLTTVVLIYKIIAIGSYTASVSTFIIPLWFTIGDIIAEIYGYKIAKHVIYMALIFQVVFALICGGVSHLDSPAGWIGQEAYKQTLGTLPRVAISSCVAIYSGAFINAYAISKWKILLSGRYFWIRSLGASAIGELIFVVVAYATEFLGTVPIPRLLHLIVIGYGAKLILNPVLVFPATWVMNKLKKSEGMNFDEYDKKFSPFGINISEQNMSL